MSALWPHIRELISSGRARASIHGLEELANDDISLKQVIAGVSTAKLVEEYPEFPKGPCVLLLQYDSAGRPLHVLWGTAKDKSDEAVLITAYRPDPRRWSDDFMTRRSS